MLTQNDLKLCCSLAREVDHMREHLDYLRAVAEKCTAAPPQHAPSSGKGVASDRVGQAVVALVDYQRQVEPSMAAYLDHVRAVEAWIAALEDPLTRTIMRLRYIEGCLWNVIADEVHLSRGRCLARHERALRILNTAR